jgi:nuclear pore complex protein Nup98-Nup96
MPDFVKANMLAATGGGLFGNTSSTFGATNNQPATGGMFGAKPAQTNTFGSGATSGLFGAKPASPFGAANTGSTQAQNPNTSNPYYGDRPAPAPPTTGTADPAYFPSWQQDPSGTSSTSNLPPHLFHNVSAMEAYRGASPDELRAMDYQQNRKNATPQQPAAGGFGAPATGGFGQAAPTNTFGQQPATSTFGAKPAGGLFGAAPAANTGFGQSSGGFGQSSTGGGMFGQTQQQPASTGFGQPAQTGGLFGQPAQAPATGGGLFGNTSTGFGAQPAQPAATNTFGSFGAAKPATTGFGAPAAGGFGSGAATNTFGQTPAAGTGSTFGGFGATQNQQQAPATGGLFGGGGFGQNNQQQQQPAAATGGLFGQPAQQPAQPAAGGLFGATAPKPGGLFGGASTTPAAGASTGFSESSRQGTGSVMLMIGFGQNNAQQPAQTGGLFGSTNNNTTNNTTSGGLFGAQNNQQQGAQQPAAGGLFGGGGGMFGAKPAAPATGGLFGSTTQNQQQPAQTGSLFGNTGQSSGGLFGSTNNTLGQQNQQQNQPKPGGLFGGGGSMFGQTQQQPQQNTTGGGLFGGLGQSQPAQTSMFGNQNQQQPQQNGMNSSLFGGLGQSTNNQSQQPSLNASIDQNPYGRNELFNYTGQKLEFGSQNKKPALPPLTASSYRITPSKNQINKLRGFATPQSPGRASTPLSSSSRNGLNSPASDRYKGLTDTALTPNAFIPRPSIKRLNVTPKTNGVNGDDHLESVLGKSALKSSTSRSNLNVSQNGLSNSATLTFNPPSSLTATNGNGNGTNDTPTRRPTPLESSRPLAVAGSERQPSQGQYWCKPRMEKLRQMGEGYLSKIPNFTIGRSGFGEVTFLEPVDVTGFDLNDLFGKVVVFTEMELAVYPDDWEDKPPQGQGLNRPARITLLNCYPRDKATKQFITDINDPRHARFLKRVKNIPETEFVSYTDDGAWTFEVKHFSKYGLRDGSDEDDEDVGDVGAIKRKMVTNGSRSAKAREAFNRPSSRTPSRTPESDEDFLPPTKSIRDMEQVEEEDSVSEEEGSQTASEQESESDQDQASSSSSASGSAPPEYDDMESVQLKLGPEGVLKLREMQSSQFGFESQHTRPEKKQVKRTLGSHLAGFGDAGEDEKMLDRAIKVTLFSMWWMELTNSVPLSA